MKFAAGIAMSFLAATAWSQNDTELTPREMFYIKAPVAAKPPNPANPVPKKTTPVNTPPADAVASAGSNQQAPAPPSIPRPPLVRVNYTPLALKYSILEKKGNQFEEVDADTQFHSGDRIRVKVEANSPAYLYIVMGGSSGQWRVLFPAKEISGGNNRIEPGAPCIIPPESDPPFYFDETAGVEKVSLVLSRSPEPDLEKLIYAAGDPARSGEPKTIMAMNNPIDGAVVGQLRNEVLARDLVFEKYDGATPEGQQEKAVYAATKDQSANARLFVDLKLVHK
jgi:hypothetical protein